MRRLLLLALLTPFLACSSEEPEGSQRRKGPAVKENLPPSPSMVEPRFVEKYVDGSYTVAGLVKGRKKHLNTAVTVTGHIKEVHRCENVSGDCDPPPHAVLVDDLQKPRRRSSSSGSDNTALPKLEQNKKYTLKALPSVGSRGPLRPHGGVLILAQLPPPPRPSSRART